MTYRAYRPWHRCGVCRTRRSSAKLLLDHKRQHPECKPCSCEGYALRHRPGSSECKQNPQWPIHDARRRGAGADEIEWLTILYGGVKAKPNEEPPF